MVEKSFLIDNFRLRTTENIGDGNPNADCLIVYDEGDLAKVKSITSFLNISDQCWHMPHPSLTRLVDEFIGILKPKLVIMMHSQCARVIGKIYNFSNNSKMIYMYTPSQMTDTATKQKAREYWNKALTFLQKMV